MRILIWHVHGGWTDAFVLGGHDYFFPWREGEPENWGGRNGRDWPPNCFEVTEADLGELEVDAVVLQNVDEIERTESLLGRTLGRDIPAVFLEHNMPMASVPNARHPLADQRDIPIVHVTHFNRLIWDTGSARTVVIEHGIADPGPQYSGQLPRLGFVANEAVRRWRVTGTDLLPQFTAAGPIDVFGIDGHFVGPHLGFERHAIDFVGDLPPLDLQTSLAQRRVYLHPVRWTSLGLSLIEAMHLAMPVVVLAATEAPLAVPREAGAISTDVRSLVREARKLVQNPDEARKRGRVARQAALERYNLARFLREWDTLLADLPAKARSMQ